MVPAPSTHRSQNAERFPCENCPCGCSTAEYCWDKCCCHSDSEKLAWAERNGVTPPAFLVARGTKFDDLSVETSKPSCCHCAKSQTETCELARSEHPPLQVSVDEQAGEAILMWKAAECRGLSYFWTMLAAVYVSPTCEPVQVDPPLLDRLSFFNVDAISRPTAPDPPIP